MSIKILKEILAIHFDLLHNQDDKKRIYNQIKKYDR